MPHLAFCANCGSERLDIIAGGRSIQIRCYVCTKTSDVSGVILGEVDFLAGAQAKVDAMIAKAKERVTCEDQVQLTANFAQALELVGQLAQPVILAAGEEQREKATT